MNEYTFSRLVDIAQVRQLLESHHALSGMAYSLFDAEMNNLIAVGWQDICVRFHRVNPDSCTRCRESDAYIKEHLHDFEGDYLQYRCKNGMIDIAMPISIDGAHLATFFTGQFFYDDDLPDRDCFIAQAGTFGFDTEEYLEALQRVPVFSREHIRGNVLFLHHMVRVLAENGLTNLRLTCEIRDRKQAEQLLAAREREFRTLAENSPDNIARYDRQCRRIYMNPILVKAFGVDPGQLLGNTPLQSYPESWIGIDEYQDKIGRVLQSGEPDEIEIAVPDASGELRIHHIRLAAERDLEGIVVGVLAIGRDITDRKREEEILRKREQEFRALVENSPDTIVRYDRECRSVYVNSAMERLFGRPACVVLGKKPTYFSPLPEMEFLEQMVLEAWEGGREFQSELPFRTARGERRWCHLRVVPEWGPDAEVVSVLAIARDITAIKNTELQLVEAQSRLSTVFATIPDLVWLKNKEGVYLACNPAVEKFFGAPEAEIVGKTDHDFVAAELADFFVLKDREAIAAGRVRINEEEITYVDDGRRGVLEIRKVPVYYPDGSIIGVLGIARDITERKQVEEALRNSERRLADIIDLLPDATFAIDLEGRVTIWNRAAEAFTGARAEEMLGKGNYEHAIPFYGERRPILIDLVLNPSDEIERRYPYAEHEDGKIVGEAYTLNVKRGEAYMLGLAAPLYDTEGRIVGAIESVRDITDRKKAEELLRKSEQEFRTLAENSPEIIIRYDRECRRVYVNPAYERETGTSFEQAVKVPIERHWRSAMPVEQYQAILRRVIETGVEAELLLEWTTSDGQLICHDVHMVAERGPDGRVLGVLAIAHIVSRLKRAERDLEESLARLRQVLLSIPDLVWLKDPEGVYIACNSAVERFVGMKEAEIVGKTDFDFLPPHLADFHRRNDNTSVEAGGTCVNEEWVFCADENRHALLETIKTPLYDLGGTLVGVLGVARDITERELAAEALRVKREQITAMAVELSLAEERERRRIASVLHDHIGQTLLLSKIKLGTLADVFESSGDGKTYEEIKALLEQTIRDVRSLTQQLNPPMLASVGLEAALEWLARRMEADYSLHVDFVDDRSAKPLTEELRAVVYQSARELLINVAKHAGTGRARLVVGRRADMLVLTVEDRGVGFAGLPDPGANMPLDCSFGLYNIRQRIKLLGGEVVIESASGRGTCATIRVPLADG